MAQNKNTGTDEPGEQAQAGDIPEQRQQGQQGQTREQEREQEREDRVERQERQMGNAALTTDDAPRVTVLGHMDSQIAVRLGWRKGMTAMSLSRFRFLKEDLGFTVEDDPDNYLF